MSLLKGGKVRMFETDYIVGCDGANSRVRRLDAPFLATRGFRGVPGTRS